MKTCTKCGVEKPLNSFGLHKKTRDGLRYDCKDCVRKYTASVKERKREYDQEYHRINKISRNESSSRYYQENKERMNKYRASWSSKNPDSDRRYRRSWADNNREKQRAYLRARYARKKLFPSELVTVKQVALRDGVYCWLCGDELSDFDPSHMDHLIPLAADPELLSIWGVENPGTVLANMALACPSCNIRKSNKILPCAIARYLRNLEPIEAAA